MSSRTRWNFLLGAAALGGLALNVSSVAAQSVQTQKLRVEASVGDVCSVTAASLDFGSEYDASAVVNATGSIEINCLVPTTLDVALDGGQQGNGGGQRTMSNGSATLAYILFTNAPSGDAWETDEAVEATITGTQSVPVYGSVPASQSITADGLYSDEVTITLIF